jgi:hypothetical protein
MPLTFPKTTPIWEYGQPWLPQVEPAFAPGRVAIRREEDDLLIHADLHDSHAMKDVFEFNFPAFMQCDAFEIFLGPADEAAYYELHVTPSNSVLQLFFDGTEEKKTLEERMVAEPLFTSETAMTAEGWSVSTRISLPRLFPDSHPEWLLSFGRYDYTPGQPKPVISSTSPHAVCSFHRKHEWRRVTLAEL